VYETGEEERVAARKDGIFSIFLKYLEKKSCSEMTSKGIHLSSLKLNNFSRKANRNLNKVSFIISA
jgi:hypothetical protein